MNILLLSPLKQGSGNLYTIDRIRRYLESDGFRCTLLAPEKFPTKDDVLELVKERNIQLIIGLHAFKSGKVLQDISVPCIIIIGGTDINECYKDEESLRVMTNSVTNARKIIAFSKGNRKRVLELWPSLVKKNIKIITQETNPSKFSLNTYIQTHYPDVYRPDLVVCTCVGSIRQVKNPLYLLEAFSDVHSRDSRVVYVLIGHIVEKEYGTSFLDKVKSLSGVIYIPGLSLADTHAAVQQSFSFINSSDSEGMSLAILEAMQLKVPVIVRDIPGNLDIVTDDVNGLVYSSPSECMNCIETLLQDGKKRDRLVETAMTYVHREHNVSDEKRQYNELVRSCIS